MSLSAALYSGITGLSAHGERMSVIGNNIANVNTTGFKSSTMYFEDAISQNIATATGTAQVGRGVQIGAIYADFTLGSLETTGEATDVAIGGNGFFTVKVPGEQTSYYTRAGNFRFDTDGYLVDTHGYRVQGWQVQKRSTTAADEDQTSAETTDTVRIVGTPTDIRLENFQSSPQATSQVSMITNLDSSETSQTNNTTNPYFALASLWNGQAEEPIPSTSYAYQATITVYDDNGSSHEVTTYFDPVPASNTGGKQVWEYVVTCDPSEDGRTIDGVKLNTTSAAGILMMGTMTFNGPGEMESMTAYTLKSNASSTRVATDGSGDTGFKALSNWTLADFSSEGYPIFTANFLEQPNASYTNVDIEANKVHAIQMNFGMQNKNLDGTYGGWDIGGAMYSNAGAIGPNLDDDIDRLPSFHDGSRNALATTSYDAGSSTLSQSQDGYTSGFLQSVSIDSDGILTGSYSNGQIIELYSLTLADFNNEWGLRSMGGNLFSETKESGTALTGTANTGGKGSIASNSLEQSNVDLATEFVSMITTQRGFQANSKVITTTDTLLGELIQLKR